MLLHHLECEASFFFFFCGTAHRSAGGSCVCGIHTAPSHPLLHDLQKKINLSKTARKTPLNAEQQSMGTSTRDENFPVPKYDDVRRPLCSPPPQPHQARRMCCVLRRM